jgi:hypothetical protein
LEVPIAHAPGQLESLAIEPKSLPVAGECALRITHAYHGIGLVTQSPDLTAKLQGLFIHVNAGLIGAALELKNAEIVESGGQIAEVA